MLFDEMTMMYTAWNTLQQPSHASPGLNASFRALLAAVDQGWQIEEPVQVLPSTRSDTWTYYFVLTHPVIQQNYRLFVPVTPEVEKFVNHSQFQVIEGSYY